MPPTLVATTGQPAASASANEMEKVSYLEQTIVIKDFFRKSEISALSQCPKNGLVCKI